VPAPLRTRTKRGDRIVPRQLASPRVNVLLVAALLSVTLGHLIEVAFIATGDSAAHA
jgi:hypothetical protein